MVKYFHPHYIKILKDRFSSFLWKIFNIIAAAYWGVKLGKNSRFKGKTNFRILPDSSIQIGNNCVFNSSKTSNLIGVYVPCMFSSLKRGAKIEIGNNCGFSGTVIGAALSVTLGDNVRCGANTLITDTDWHTDDPRTTPDKPIVIKNNVWLGYGVKVLKGVTIGENSLIGACSVVTKDIPPNVVAAGNPCRVIKIIENE